MEVETKERMGDWEMDTVVSQGRKQALLPLTDRKSRLILTKEDCESNSYFSKE